jgi:hypothetical protein
MPRFGPPTSLPPSAPPMPQATKQDLRETVRHPVSLASFARRCVQGGGAAPGGVAEQTALARRAEPEAAHQPGPFAELVRDDSMTIFRCTGVICMARPAKKGTKVLRSSQQIGGEITPISTHLVQDTGASPRHPPSALAPFRRHTGRVAQHVYLCRARSVGALGSRRSPLLASHCCASLLA